MSAHHDVNEGMLGVNCVLGERVKGQVVWAVCGFCREKVINVG